MEDGRFTARADFVFRGTLIAIPLGLAVVGAGLGYYGNNKYLEVGYAPVQPVPFSHRLHAGELGMDCRACHSQVETSAHAGIPTTETCMNCHAKVRTESADLLPVRESFASGAPLEWVRVHALPDYVHFDHSIHVTAGVACSSCHGRVDQMEVVRQVEPLSMGFCLDCHRDNAREVTSPPAATRMGAIAALQPQVFEPERPRAAHPPEHCSACHY